MDFFEDLSKINQYFLYSVHVLILPLLKKSFEEMLWKKVMVCFGMQKE